MSPCVDRATCESGPDATVVAIDRKRGRIESCYITRLISHGDSKRSIEGGDRRTIISHGLKLDNIVPHCRFTTRRTSCREECCGVELVGLEGGVRIILTKVIGNGKCCVAVHKRA